MVFPVETTDISPHYLIFSNMVRGLPSIIKGPQNNAIHFSGSDVIITSGPAHLCILNIDQCKRGFSLSLWIKVQNHSEGTFLSTQKYSVNDTLHGLQIKIRKGGELDVTVNVLDEAWQVQSVISTNIWTHLSVTWEKVNGLNIYINTIWAGHGSINVTPYSLMSTVPKEGMNYSLTVGGSDIR